MKIKANQNDDLVKIISAQTGQKREIVAAFIVAQFEEIEKLLVSTSTAEVEGFGVFRVIKTTAENKVLFIPSSEEINEKTIDSFRQGKKAEDPIITQNNNSRSNTNGFFSQSKDNENKEKGGMSQDEEYLSTESNLDTEDLSEKYKKWDSFYDSEEPENKKKWVTIGFIIILISLIGLFIANLF